ncbi:hypothetical protein MWLp12_3089 [Lactiplantibacillus plantarum]|nr:hypothetical protein MWLp12_3089 [Lactiplantibacillus plantarum]
MVNTILKEADLFCPNSVRINFTIYHVFKYSPYKLYQFHVLVMDEMQLRCYHPNKIWYDPNYRGQFCPPYDHLTPIALTTPIYPEHNASYLAECVRNLAAKGIIMPTT